MFWINLNNGLNAVSKSKTAMKRLCKYGGYIEKVKPCFV
ncbi:hypothetical protein l11_09990 [Neisseria weaveri LMG 5135]|nr:hypothetical protein l13_15120 [Neisseria weaveri ATCC 51223]EGV37758.1 hypothetical protein l11_09990 [Neisseria weaveri LMG 5135]